MLHVIFNRSRRAGIIALLAAAVALVLGAVLATSLRAQPAPAFHFVYLRSIDTLGTEVVTPGPSSIVGLLTMRGAPVIRWEQQHVNTTPGRLTLSVFAPGAPTSGLPTQNVVVNMVGDSAKLTISANGTTSEQTLASAIGAVALVGNSVLHSALMADHARGAKKTSLPVFLTNGGRTMTASVTEQGDTTVFSIAGMDVRILWDPNGGPREMSIPAQNLRVVRASGVSGGAATGTASATTAPVKIDYSAPAGAPYTAEDVVIPTPRGYTLAGTLTRPKGAAKLPVVITISGSGPQDRDSRISIVRNYAPFRDIADTLGRRGIAVLRFDDRGVGASGGASSRANATSADFADDVAAVVAYLRTRSDVDGTRIALAGHSEGGLIAPLVAAKDPTLRAVVLLAGPAYNGRRILEFQNENAIKSATQITEAQRDSIRRTVPKGLDSIAATNPWMGYFMRTEPSAALRGVKQPTLILQGNTDQQVTPEQADSIATILKASGNTRVTLRHFPATNHLFLVDPSGAPGGYTALKDTRVRRDVLGALADWMVQVMR
ncbi:alpha/beta hydrolase family protein [Gemmatimonas groenlandica]|uniref:Alpha/beta fold hydrolase n=1 Tax=Gemmatimonas groenlandica TaxID=2732249 RepID=A0A6M4IW48_9BACT|nr:alpha/beta fold hydrolase [Gemmatimonas groenlandica]QJR37102.1 alpha/beta fold hydrolase [Gemmatimonas groenlandica]